MFKQLKLKYKLSRKEILIDIFNRQKMSVEEFDHLRNLMLLKKWNVHIVIKI